MFVPTRTIPLLKARRPPPYPSTVGAHVRPPSWTPTYTEEIDYIDRSLHSNTRLIYLHRFLPRAPVHELPARVALHGEGDHHPNADLLLGIALQPRDLLGIEVRREVLVEHFAFTHGGRPAVASLTGRKRSRLLYVGREESTFTLSGMVVLSRAVCGCVGTGRTEACTITRGVVVDTWGRRSDIAYRAPLLVGLCRFCFLALCAV